LTPEVAFQSEQRGAPFSAARFKIFKVLPQPRADSCPPASGHNGREFRDLSSKFNIIILTRAIRLRFRPGRYLLLMTLV
jgi:hypothetical protein